MDKWKVPQTSPFNVYVNSLVNWDQKCFMQHFKGIVIRGLKEEIQSHTVEANTVLQEGGPDAEEKAKLLNGMADSYRKILKGVELIPECPKEKE